MTHDNENTAAISAMAETRSEPGFDGLASAFLVLLNELMLIERDQYPGAAFCERSESRKGYVVQDSVFAYS